MDGRRGRVATLYSDPNNTIVYSCNENEINGVITGKGKYQSTDAMILIKILNNFLNKFSNHLFHSYIQRVHTLSFTRKLDRRHRFQGLYRQIGRKYKTDNISKNI
jgi:hypothetical protein